MLGLEREFGFRIKTVQTDNGKGFKNDEEKTNKVSLFEVIAKKLEIKLKQIRSYSPWKNVEVERSHREGGRILYNNAKFKSYEDLVEKVRKHQSRYNKTTKQVLKFKSPNQIVNEYFLKIA